MQLNRYLESSGSTSVHTRTHSAPHLPQAALSLLLLLLLLWLATAKRTKPSTTTSERWRAARRCQRTKGVVGPTPTSKRSKARPSCCLGLGGRSAEAAAPTKSSRATTKRARLAKA
jgi:hypothetical protein